MGMGIGEQLGASLTGNVENAYIVVYDFRKKADALSQSVGGMDTITRDQQSELAMNLFRDSLSESAGNPSMMSNAKNLTATDTAMGNTKIYRLQFNPSEFQVYASALPVNKVDATGNPNAMNAMQAPGLTFSTSFWFDKATTWECFPGDKFNGGLTSPTGLVKNIASVAMGAKNGAPTVRPTVEAFLAALRNPFTRMISFRWCDFFFTGELLSIGATYTMFSSQGEPVRAQIDMRMQQKLDNAILQPWYKNFDDVIKADSQKSLTSTQQRFDSVLNVSL